MDLLRESSYDLDVSPDFVHFSAEFKKLFYEALQAGKELREREIVIELGCI